MGDEDKGVTLTHSQSVNRLKEITAELVRLEELDTLRSWVVPPDHGVSISRRSVVPARSWPRSPAGFASR